MTLTTITPTRKARRKTGALVLVMIGALLSLACQVISEERVLAGTSLQSAADDAYARLLKIFQQWSPGLCRDGGPGGPACNYWQLGNAFDTIIDYLSTNRSQADAFAQAVLHTYAVTS